MNRLLFLFTCVVLCTSSWGTEQIDDVFSIENNRYTINDLPLNQLFEQEHLSEIFQQRMCSASWRGYKAHWQLKEGYLLLRSILKNPCSDKHEYVDASVLFGQQYYPIRADWFTGTISLPVGETDYKYGKSEDDLLGYDIDVFVFHFKDGKLVSKGVEVYKQRYDKEIMEELQRRYEIPNNFSH